MESTGAFGKVFQLAKERVFGVAALEAHDLTPYLKEAAEGLRRQTAEHNMRDDPITGGGSDEEDNGWVATAAADSVSTTTTDQREGTQMDLVPPRQVDTARFEQEPESEPEPASGSFWNFGSAAADTEAAAAPKSIDVYGPALAQLMQMVAEMQRGQREVTNRLNSQAEELARANRILDRVDKHTKRT
eukprot:COSAG06_NODE_3419_length_5371_cov_12.650640_3_plen_188_part_00